MNPNKMLYIPADRFVIRVPFLPIESLNENFQSVETLFNLFSDSVVAEAIYIASPVLYREIKKAIASPEHFSAKDMNKIIYSFARYINRMATRCTPFGMFAGCAVGNIGEHTSVEIGNHIQRHARLDMDFLYKLYSDLISTSDMSDHIKYFPNSSIYTIGNKYRYVELCLVGVEREYHIVEIAKNRYLDKILKKAKSGVTLNLLIDFLVKNGINKNNANEFVHSLVDEQVLIPELNQSIVGNDFLHRLTALCHKIGLSEGRFSLLDQMEEIISLINKSDSFPHSKYESVANLATKSGISFDKSKLFQVDCSFDVSATIGNDIIEELNKTMSFLNRLQRRGGKSTLDKFKSDFINRYETQEIPLMEVLDPDVGLGYPSGTHSLEESPLLQKYGVNQQQSNTMQLGLMEQWLFGKAMKAIQNKTYLSFTDDDIKGMDEDWSLFQPTMGVMFELLKHNDENHIFFISAGISNLLTRFAHINDDLFSVVKSIADYEQDFVSDDVCLAEIVHLPEGRIGNILSRPDIRKYKIMYMASPSGEGKEIPMSDIMVSVRNNKIYLRSKSDDRQIIPYLTSAHNYYLRTMPAYKFLCDIQNSHILMFSWGALENLLPFRPRVVYGKTVLFPACWSITKKECENWTSITSDDELLSITEKWRLEKEIPLYTLLADGDNKLFVDWNNAISIKSFLSIVCKRQAFTLEEVLYNPEDLIVKGEAGHHTNQIILPYLRQK